MADRIVEYHRSGGGGLGKVAVPLLQSGYGIGIAVRRLTAYSGEIHEKESLVGVDQTRQRQRTADGKAEAALCVSRFSDGLPAQRVGVGIEFGVPESKE